MDLSNKPKFGLIFLSFLFFLALAPLSSAELKIGSSENVRGVVIGQNRGTDSCVGCNASNTNISVLSNYFLRIDGSNRMNNLAKIMWSGANPYISGDTGDILHIRDFGVLDFLSSGGSGLSLDEGFAGHGLYIIGSSAFPGVNITDNLTVSGQVRSIQNQFCNATNCYTLAQFLNDTQGSISGNITVENLSAKNVNAAGNITGGDRLYIGGSPVSVESGDPVVYIQTTSGQAFALNGTQVDTTFFQGRTPAGLLAITEKTVSFAFGAIIDNTVSGVVSLSTGSGGALNILQTAASSTFIKLGSDSSGSRLEDIIQAEAAFGGTNALGANLTLKAGNSTGNGSSYYNIWSTRGGQGQGTTQRASELTIAANANNTNVYSNLTLKDRLFVNGNLYFRNATNTIMDRCTLSSGACTIANTQVTANTNIFCFEQTQGGTVGSIGVSGRNAGVNYSIASSNVLDTSIVACTLINPFGGFV